MISERLVVDGNSLTVDQLIAIGPNTQISLSEAAWEAVRNARAVVNRIIKEGRVVYGINTGFGHFSEVVIAPEKLKLLQENLIRSHASGVGEPMTQARTKRLLALRINTLAKGYSGISEESLRRLVAFFNANVISKVPEQGTLGASGDLAPLSHLALGMLGDGEMWHPTSGKLVPAKEIIEEFNLKTLKLGPKEGLALINGTQQITTLGAEALARAESLVVIADAITALSLEALQGTVTAYFSEIHRARPHAGQSRSARTLRSLLSSSIYPSKLAIDHLNCGKVQDAYSLRCSPQVHGVVYDTIEFVKGILEIEMNSATDNPIVFSDTGRILSGGNFHGEYPAKALDYLTIAIHELSNISERRIERLVNNKSSGLPDFLVAEGGLNSGFMIAHCTAASLVSENKTLCHPASVDSLSSSAGKEDHVSMGGWAARKCLKVIENVENVLAIEYLCAAQGLDLRRPRTSTEPIEALHTLLRDAGVKKWDADRFMTPDIEIAVKLIREKSMLNLLQPYFARWAKLDPNNNYAISDEMAHKILEIPHDGIISR